MNEDEQISDGVLIQSITNYFNKQIENYNSGYFLFYGEIIWIRFDIYREACDFLKKINQEYLKNKVFGNISGQIGNLKIPESFRGYNFSFLNFIIIPKETTLNRILNSNKLKLDFEAIDENKIKTDFQREFKIKGKPQKIEFEKRIFYKVDLIPILN